MRNIFNFTIMILIYSCSPYSKEIESALKLAGNNRPELEKVLEHYGKTPADSLKLKAAKFLIENMDGCFFYTSPELDAYYVALDSIFSLNERYEYMTEEQEILLRQLQKPNPDNFQIVRDLQYVSAEFLIDNIDRAFEDWKLPHAKALDFDDFCEYLLPYKSGRTERPDFWRLIYKDAFSSYIKAGVDVSCNPDSGLISTIPSIVLNGKNYLSLPENFDTIPEFTISCWVTPSEYRTNARLFDFGRDRSWYVCFIPYSYGGVAQFQLVTMPHIWDGISHSDPLPLAQRSHIAVTYSDNIISFYIDGVLQKRRRTYLTGKDLTGNYIGKSQNISGNDNYFKGEITDFRLYNRELNFTEICHISGKTDLPEWRPRIQLIVQGIGHAYTVRGINEPLPGGYRSAQLINMKQGACDDYVVLGTTIFRSLSIPSAIDFIPQWATRSVGHSWNAIYTDNGRMDDYSFGDWMDSIGHHIKVHGEKAAKIYRRTYAKQPESLAMQSKKVANLPPLFRDPRIKDVTDNYLDCIDITVSLTQKPVRNSNYAYLSNFNNRDWIPVHWGEIEEGKVVFTKMGKDIAYLPVYYHDKGVQPAAEPFILTKEGNIKEIVPDHSQTQTLILTRKYKPGSVPEKGKLLMGGRFQVANREDFSDSLTVYIVEDIPEIRYNPVNLTLNSDYRYFRFLAAPGTWGGEISEIEIYSSESGTRLLGSVIGNKNSPSGWEAENVFDGDPLTSYLCVWNEIGWVGLDFGKPVNITSFRYLPRNDDNFIKEGEEYELFYWDSNQWNSLGKQIGTSKQYLEYTNAPLGALFWLRNLTKGREERIFTYENGEQVWW
jgi:hypothetical protein